MLRAQVAELAEELGALEEFLSEVDAGASVH